jgi:DNA-binding NtrC family response regulator
MKPASLLLVDDDRHLLQSMAEWLREIGYRADTAATLAEANAAIDKRHYDLALVDVRLGEQDGFEVLAHARRVRPEAAVVMMTGYGSVESAVEAIRAGAFDFLTKPIIDAELQLSIERALNQKQLIEENKNLVNQLEARYGMESIVGHDRRMLKVFDMISSIADTKASVLITGESGTGKSMVARAIHRRSGRRGGPFVEVACGALPETLLESELFGHVAGAFTGATGDKVGKFKQADGGTIFLDEIGTASPGFQVKLLRVLQDLEFEPVGGSKTERVDTRVILATNENLDALVQQGKFRLDLYYRINVINIELPALRERIADIPLLAKHFLDEVNAESGRHVAGFTDEAVAALQRYGWPGNVRELQNCVERAVLLGKGDVIGVDDLPSTLSNFRAVPVDPVGAKTLKQALQAPERQMILEVLETHHWNRQETAAALGMNRTTLYKKMKKLGLDSPQEAAQ